MLRLSSFPRYVCLSPLSILASLAEKYQFRLNYAKSFLKMTQNSTKNAPKCKKIAKCKKTPKIQKQNIIRTSLIGTCTCCTIMSCICSSGTSTRGLAVAVTELCSTSRSHYETVHVHCTIICSVQSGNLAQSADCTVQSADCTVAVCRLHAMQSADCARAVHARVCFGEITSKKTERIVMIL